VAFKIPKPFLRALGEAKKYTPLDPKIFQMMMKAGIGVDPKDLKGTAPFPGMGSMGRYQPKGWGPGSVMASGKNLERFGPRKPSRADELQSGVRKEKLTQALARNNKPKRQGIPTGLTAQRKAQEKSRHRS
jgi:hypothetical protein